MRARRFLSLATTALTIGVLGATTHAAYAAPNDPLYARQWGPQQVHAEQAWTISRGGGAVIAVVDTGVDLGHPDLARKLVTGATFVDCGNRSCGNGDWKGPDGVGQPADSHGTHVSGIAAAATGNGVGIAGVAPDAKIMPIKVLEDGSGSFEDIALGIRWAADHGADVVNLSLGAVQGVQVLVVTGVISDVQDAITYANAKGVAVIAAAGNDAVPLCNTPGFDQGAICVTATDKREAPAAYSSGAIKPDLKSLAGPGGSLLSSSLTCTEDVVSAVPRGTGTFTSCGYTKDYDEYAGTSMATPHVAGVAALLAAQGRSLQNIYDAILTTARTPGAAVRGVWNPEYGYGIVDAAAAVRAPGAPAKSKG